MVGFSCASPRTDVIKDSASSVLWTAGVRHATEIGSALAATIQIGSVIAVVKFRERDMALSARTRFAAFTCVVLVGSTSP